MRKRSLVVKCVSSPVCLARRGCSSVCALPRITLHAPLPPILLSPSPVCGRARSPPTCPACAHPLSTCPSPCRACVSWTSGCSWTPLLRCSATRSVPARQLHFTCCVCFMLVALGCSGTPSMAWSWRSNIWSAVARTGHTGALTHSTWSVL